jgi:hypothetical protein
MIVRSARLGLIALGLFALAFGTACRRKDAPAPPVAAGTVQLSRDKAPLGSPLDITYKFVVANDARITEDYKVMVHVVDTDGELIFTFDHEPPVPTTQWKPGQTIEYTRTEFVPIYPYVGEAVIELGLYTAQKRLPLAGEDAGQRAYKVAKVQLQPQTENVFLVSKDGWHPPETPEHNTSVEWQWTKQSATYAFKNPKKDCLFYLDVDHPGNVFLEPQQVQVSVGGQQVDQFTLKAGQQELRKIPITAAQFGTGDMAEIQIAVDKTYVPALVNAAYKKDSRELGVRVFHAYVQPRQ